jgi:hypothetical protein
MIQAQWRDLAEFQLHLAERWLDRGAKSMDAYARFFFYFAGINALYYLWSKVDNVRGRAPDQPPNEAKQIEHLLGKVTPAQASQLVAAAHASVQFFGARRPIERMDKRSSGRATVGDAREGKKAREVLLQGSDQERVSALGKILYLVRSNLVHGSKMDQGDDEQVITNSVLGLQAILEWGITWTHSELGRS